MKLNYEAVIHNLVEKNRALADMVRDIEDRWVDEEEESERIYFNLEQLEESLNIEDDLPEEE